MKRLIGAALAGALRWPSCGITSVSRGKRRHFRPTRRCIRCDDFTTHQRAPIFRRIIANGLAGSRIHLIITPALITIGVALYAPRAVSRSGLGFGPFW